MKNRFGFSVTELLVTVGIGAVVIGVLGVTMSNFKKTQVNLERDQSFAQYRAQLERILRSDAAYKTTRDNNSSAMNCVVNKVNCYAQSGQINLYDEKGNVVPFLSTDSNPSQGLSPKGAVCNTFDYNNGNASCPFKWVAQWSAVCSGNPCLNPTVKISVVLNYSKNAPIGNFPTSSFYLTHDHQQVATSNTDVCSTMGGVLMAVPGGTKCVRPSGINLSSCPDGQYVIGFTAQGDVRCQSYSSISCPVGQIIQGVKADGTVECAIGCKTASAPKCYPPPGNSVYGRQVRSLLAAGRISRSQVAGMGCIP